MKHESIRTIAGQVPTTVEELTSLGVLGENIIKEYGTYMDCTRQTVVTGSHTTTTKR